ncbi:MAG: hypothetical protein HUJ68_09305 [Clostridia bacterium]|nr:hypothetical protein [Clostridia bacterium]
MAKNKFFYEQLGEESKTIYQALEANKENMKTGTYKIQFGNTFSNLLKRDDGSEKLGEYYQSAMEAFIYDNAEMLYISPNKMYLEIITFSNNKFEVSISNGNAENYLADEFSNSAQVNSAVKEVENVKNELLKKKTGNKYNDIKMVHDYLVDTIEYDQSISEPNIYDIYGALVRKIAVCEGYARAFKYIMDEMGINCVLIMGNGTNSQGQTENHAWNYVELDGKWYALDATWDDPIIIGNGTVTKDTKYKYFLKGSNTMSSNHRPNGQFTQGGKVFSYPQLSVTDY